MTAGGDRVPVVLVIDDIRPSGAMFYRIETKNGTQLSGDLWTMPGEVRSAIIAAAVENTPAPDRAAWAEDLLARVVLQMNRMGGDAECVALLAEYETFCKQVPS